MQLKLMAQIINWTEVVVSNASNTREMWIISNNHRCALTLMESHRNGCVLSSPLPYVLRLQANHQLFNSNKFQYIANT